MKIWKLLQLLVLLKKSKKEIILKIFDMVGLYTTAEPRTHATRKKKENVPVLLPCLLALLDGCYRWFILFFSQSSMYLEIPCMPAISGLAR